MKFIQNITYIYTGSWVRLSDNRMAEIMFINYSNISKPIIKIDDEIIDLARNPQLTIASMA